MQTVENMFDDADNAAPPGEGGHYLKEGTHIVRVDRFFPHTNRRKVPGVIAELTILHSTNPEYKAGDPGSWLQRAGKDGYEGRCRKFGAEVQGVPYEAFKKAELFAALNPVNPFNGKVVQVECYKTTTKTTKVEIIGSTWKRLPPDHLASWTAYAQSIKVAAPIKIEE